MKFTREELKNDPSCKEYRELYPYKGCVSPNEECHCWEAGLFEGADPSNTEIDDIRFNELVAQVEGLPWRFKERLELMFKDGKFDR